MRAGNYLLPAESGKRRSNCEKPECYALFPYRLFGVGLPGLDLARETFRLSPKSMKGQPRSNGWVQDSIFAASVGDVEGAAQMLVARSKLFDKASRFPAFWGPNFDWTPDQDHGGVNMIALQQMLMQTDPSSGKIHLCPAWPEAWDCSFKLHAPGQTIVQGKVRNGRVVDLVVTPETRRKDLVIHSKGTIPLQGRSEVVPGADYSLFIHLPPGAPATSTPTASTGGNPIPVRQERAGDLLAVSFKSPQSPVTWQVKF